MQVILSTPGESACPAFMAAGELTIVLATRRGTLYNPLNPDQESGLQRPVRALREPVAHWRLECIDLFIDLFTNASQS